MWNLFSLAFFTIIGTICASEVEKVSQLEVTISVDPREIYYIHISEYFLILFPPIIAL